MFPLKLRIGVLAFAASLIAVGSDARIGCTAGTDPQAKEPQQRNAEPALADEATEQPQRRLNATGKVVDQNGTPIAEATVYVRIWPSVLRRTNRDQEVNDILATATTDGQGRFAFKDVAAPEASAPRIERIPWEVIVLAKGRAVSWKPLTFLNQRRQLSFKLDEEARFEGRVVDPEVKPIAGADVEVLQLCQLHQDPLREPEGPGVLSLGWSQLPLRTKSNADGAFVLSGLPRNLRVFLKVSRDGFPRQFVYAATTDQAQPSHIDTSITPQGQKQRRKHTVHISPLRVTLQPGQRLYGQVVAADTGSPVKGVRVTAVGFTIAYAVTDAEGRYSFPSLEPQEYVVTAHGPADGDLLESSTQVVIRPGQRAVEHDIKLSRGIPVTVQVTDERTGKVIADVRLVQRSDTGTRKERQASVQVMATAATANRAGHARIVLPPGKAQFSLIGVVPGYVLPDPFARGREQVPGRFAQEVDLRPDQKPVEIHFALAARAGDTGAESTGRVIGQVIDLAGKPVARAMVEGSAKTAGPGSLPYKARTDAQGRFVLRTSRAAQIYELDVSCPERSLRAQVAVPPARDNKPPSIQVRLQPAAGVALRVVDEDGKPVPEAIVVVRRKSEDAGYAISGQPDAISSDVADAEGRFVIQTLLPGQEHHVVVWAIGYRAAQSEPFVAAADQIHDLGNLTIQKADQFVAGVVLDRSGKPLANIEIRAGADRTGNRRVSSPTRSTGDHQAVTDETGRFRIGGLPKGPAVLVVNVLDKEEQAARERRRQQLDARQPLEKPRYAPLILRVQAGQQGLRVVLPEGPGKTAAEAAVSKPAPEFAVRQWLQREGAPPERGFVREDFRGKVVVVAFLDDARPSQRLLPQLTRLHEQFAGKGVVVVRVYAAGTEGDWANRSPTAVALVAPGVVPGNDSEVFQKYGVQATPALFVIDRDGLLRHANLDVDALTTRVAELLKP